MSQPLQNKQILVTREEKQAKSFSNKIREQGGLPIEVPLLKISCKHVEEPKKITKLLSECEWLFFTSANGVYCFLSMIGSVKKWNKLVNQCRIAVIGDKTAVALREFGHKAHFIPTVYKASVMAEEFLSKYPEVERVLLIRGSLAREELFNRLKKQDLLVQALEVYDTVFNYEVSSELNNQLQLNLFDFLTFTSPSTVEAFVHMAHKQQYSHIPIVCIGPTTKEYAEKYGFTKIITPKQFTIEGMVEQMTLFKRKEDK